MGPNIEHAQDWLRAGDIAPDPRADPRDAQTEDRDRRAVAIKAAFTGEQGRLALETILAMSLFRAPVDHRLQGAEYRQYAQLREGQNQTAAGILAYLEIAENLERKTHVHVRTRRSGASASPGPSGSLLAPDLAVTLAHTREPGADGAGDDGSDDWLAHAAGGPLTALS